MRVRSTLDCVAFGRAFAAGKWTDIDDMSEEPRAALLANPTFVTEPAKASPPKPVAVSPTWSDDGSPEPAKAAEPGA